MRYNLNFFFNFRCSRRWNLRDLWCLDCYAFGCLHHHNIGLHNQVSILIYYCKNSDSGQSKKPRDTNNVGCDGLWPLWKLKMKLPRYSHSLSSIRKIVHIVIVSQFWLLRMPIRQIRFVIVNRRFTSYILLYFDDVDFLLALTFRDVDFDFWSNKASWFSSHLYLQCWVENKWSTLPFNVNKYKFGFAIWKNSLNLHTNVSIMRVLTYQKKLQNIFCFIRMRSAKM